MDQPYKNKLLSHKGAIPFSPFDGRRLGTPNKDIPPPPVSKDDTKQF